MQSGVLVEIFAAPARRSVPRSTAARFGWLAAGISALLSVSCGDKASDDADAGDGGEGVVNTVEDTGADDATGDGSGGGAGDGETGSDDGSDGGDGGGGSEDGGSGGANVATVYPADPTTADTLQCLLDGALAVAASLPVTWMADGVEQTERADGDVDPSYTHSGQEWGCTVTTDTETATSEPVVVSACGGALRFSGGSTAERAPSRLGTNITVEAWIRFDSADQGTFLTVGRGPYHGLELAYSSALELYYKWGNWNDQWERWYSGTTVHGDGWHHVAVVFEEPDFRVYVDGRYASGTSSPETLRFDGSYGITFSPADGWIDEVHVTRSVLYNSNFTPPYPLAADSETDALFHLDEGDGITIIDHGPDAVHGTTTATRSDESAGCSE